MLIIATCASKIGVILRAYARVNRNQLLIAENADLDINESISDLATHKGSILGLAPASWKDFTLLAAIVLVLLDTIAPVRDPVRLRKVLKTLVSFC